MEQTKKYPSQINTKTIACRISSTDYVNFLQDAISKGITLNDWLLMKIYSNNESKISSPQTSKPNKNDAGVFPITFNNERVGEITFDSVDDVIFYTNDLLNKYYDVFDLSIDYAEKLGKAQVKLEWVDIDLTNDKTLRAAINTFIKHLKTIEYENEEDKASDIREFKQMCKELFLDI